MGETADAVRTLRPAGRSADRVVRWWAGERGGWGRALYHLLAPAELAYRVAVGLHHGAYTRGVRRSRTVRAPVVSIGNLSVGGTGKTPVAGWLVEQIRRRGGRPGLVHGGYAADEPALHRAWFPDLPVIVDRDRVAGARRAIERGATALVLDDAFQHRRIARDVDIVLLAAEQWTPGPRLLPRGPWREPMRALRRADAVIVTRKTASAAVAERVVDAGRTVAPDAHWARLHLRPERWRRADAAESGAGPDGAAIAVAGIARPDPFLEHAREAGARVETALWYPDHHPYTGRDLDRIRAVADGRPVVTTAKDAIKLRELAHTLETWVLEQEVVIEAGETGLAGLLDEVDEGAA